MAQTVRILLFFFIFILSATVRCLSVFSRGECYFNTKGSCYHMGQLYAIGDIWITEDCYQCVCMEPFGIGCCDHGSQPVDYPDWCEVVRKPDSCTSVAVMKANNKLPCRWGRGVFTLRPAAGKTSDNDPFFGLVG